MRRIVPICLVAFLVSGCAHFRVAPEGYSPSTIEEKRGVHALAWGALEPSITPDNCHGNGMAHVTVKITLLNSLAAVATLGFWQPVTVEWSCAKEPAGVRR